MPCGSQNEHRSSTICTQDAIGDFFLEYFGMLTMVGQDAWLQGAEDKQMQVQMITDLKGEEARQDGTVWESRVGKGF